MSTNAIIESAPPAVLEAEPQVVSKGFDGRKKLIGAIAAALLIGGAGAGFVLLGGDSDEKPSAAGASPDAYIEVPPMVVNLRGGDGQARFLKLRFVIVATSASKSEQVRAKLPFILDALQPFLRELRPEDLNGSAAVFRVKEEMMTRIIGTLGSETVRDVLIQDLVQQ